MRIFILPPSFLGTTEFQLDKKDSHYLTRVLRLHIGDVFPGRDRQGNDWDLLLSEIGKQTVLLTCTPAVNLTANEHYVIKKNSMYLFQCICKGKKMDQIIRQSTEIGVSGITPVNSRYTIPVADSFSPVSQQKTQRWEVIIKEALQQSGSQVLTKLHQPQSFNELMDFLVDDYTGLFFHHEQISSKTLIETISEYKLSEARLPLAILIGPEGGFSPEEVDKMKKTGLKPAFLNTNILRAETAAVYALAAVQTLLSN